MHSYYFSFEHEPESCFKLQRQCEQARLREYEEKMIVTAWYNKVPWGYSGLYF